MEEFRQEENLKNEQLYDDTLSVTEVLRSHLYETSKWAKIVGTIGIIAGVFLVALAFFGSFFGSMVLKELSEKGNGSAIGSLLFVAYGLSGALVMFISYKLYRFAAKTKGGILYMVQHDLEEGLNNLRQYFKITAVLQLIVVVFYALILVAAVVGGSIGALIK